MTNYVLLNFNNLNNDIIIIVRNIENINVVAKYAVQ